MQLAYLPTTNSQQKPQDVRLLLPVKLFEVLKGTHLRMKVSASTAIVTSPHADKGGPQALHRRNYLLFEVMRDGGLASLVERKASANLVKW